MKPEITTPNII